MRNSRRGSVAMDIYSPDFDGQMAWDFATPPANSTHRFIEFLRSEPTPNEVAQELVLGYLTSFHARASVISLVQPDATLRYAGGFGLPEDSLVRWGTGSVWDDLPSAAAIRSRTSITSVTTPNDGTGNRSTVELETTHPVVAAPLATSAATLGSVCVCLGTEEGVAAATAAARELQSLSDVYVLYLLTNDAGPGSTQTPMTRPQRHVKTGPDTSTSSDFTDRRKTVLALLSEGMTYDQIAHRIGYSHSTVRMELMHVYRVLGVSSRREAVAHATRLGLVPQLEYAGAPSPTTADEGRR